VPIRVVARKEPRWEAGLLGVAREERDSMISIYVLISER
jgi:hypothetical protein